MGLRAKYALEVAALAAVYASAAHLGLLLDPVGGFATLVWPPTGISLAALIICGRRLWPGVAIGAFIANVAAGATMPVALGISAGNTLEAISAAYVLSRWCGFRPALDRVRDVVALVGVGACASTAISATAGVASLWLGGDLAEPELALTWVAWWGGDLSADLLIAPLLLTFSARAPRSTKRGRAVEIAALGGSMIALTLFAFFRWLPWLLPSLRSPHLLGPLRIWAAVRFGPRGAAASTFVLAASGIAATILGIGPFVQETLHQSLEELQGYLATTSVTWLVLGAVAAERAKQLAAAQQSQLEQSAIVDAAPDAIVTIDRRGTIREFNRSAERIFGMDRNDAIGHDLVSLLAPERTREVAARTLDLWLESGGLVDQRATFRALRSDGTEFPAAFRLTRVPLAGAPMFTGFIRDVTAEAELDALRRQSQEELELKIRGRTEDLVRLNESLARREVQLSDAQALAQVGSFEWELSSGFVTCSEELFRIYGLTPGAPLSFDSFFAWVHPDDRSRVDSAFARALTDHRPFELELRIVRADRTTRLLSARGRVDADPSGTVVRLRGTCQDVTERRRAEEARSRLASIVEYSADAIVGYSAGGVVVSWNRAAEVMFGYTESQAIGRPYSTLVPAERGHESRDMLERAARGEHIMNFETLRMRAGGERFYASVTVSPILDSAARFIGTSVITRDVTEYKKAQAKFRRFVEAAPDAMVIVDQEGQIVLVNTETERMFGYARAELLGECVDLLVPRRYRERHVSHRGAFFKDAKVRPMGAGLELFGLRKDETEFPVEISLAPIESESGLLVSASIRDATQKKAVDMKLRSSLKEKEVLLREIHHRVKNNLQVIASLLSLQASTVPKELRPSFDESQHRILSMSLVHELLYQSDDLASIEISTYLQKLVRQLVDSYQREPPRVTFSVNAPNIHLHIDASIPCGLIVNELVTNCMKHAFPGERRGHIEVSLVRDEAGLLVLRVRDDGIGFADPSCLDSPRTLGWQIVRSLTRQLGGSVSAVAEHGTDVRLVFPPSNEISGRGG